MKDLRTVEQIVLPFWNVFNYPNTQILGW